MTPERWDRIKSIFHAALDRPPADRPAYLREACGDDEELVREVESLLDSDQQPEDGLSRIALRYAEEARQDHETIGRRIGPYCLVRELGEGGMGVVYLAERVGEFRQQVALKLVRPGMASRTVVSRFRHERQILAVLEHPNIARLLDGGATADGQPYLVMEYVEGTAITAHAGERRLTIRERLVLFRQVCAAVQYAHQNLVVHRDIKPANILVTADGTPKLMDFGIAKLLADETGADAGPRTQTGARAMTPEYASPEQVRGLPITTATDVYSLGVVLYELLTARKPYSLTTDTPSDIERVIVDSQPPPPSAVGAGESRALQGDLDTIVLKALEKDPARRYGSVEQLSADIQRHLDGVPILARPQTLGYRTSRFVRRHRIGVAAAAVVVVSLVAGLSAAVWQARIARRERVLADRRFNDVRELAHAFVFDFHDAIKDLPGAVPARRLVVSKALQYLNTLSAESATDAGLSLELAEAYLRVGDVQGNPTLANLGDSAGATQSYERALALAAAVLRRDAVNRTAQQLVARAHEEIGAVLFTAGNPAPALPHYQEMVRLAEALAASAPDDAASQQLLTNAYESMGDASGHPGYPSLGDTRTARDAYTKARAVSARLSERDPANTRARRGVGLMDMKIADVDSSTGDLEAAVREYESAIAIIGAVSASDPLNTTTHIMVAVATGKLAQAHQFAGHTAEALAGYERAAAINREMMNADQRNAQARNAYALSLAAWANFLHTSGNVPAAAAMSREALSLLREVMTIQASPVRTARYANALATVAKIDAEQGRADEARRFYQEAMPLLQTGADRSGATFDDQSVYAEHLLTCPYAEFRDPARAVQYAKRAVSLTHVAQPRYLEQLSRAYEASGDLRSATTAEEQAIALMPGSSPWRTIAERRLALLKQPSPRPADR